MSSYTRMQIFCVNALAHVFSIIHYELIVLQHTRHFNRQLRFHDHRTTLLLEGISITEYE